MPHHPLSEEFFPNIQFKPPMAHLEAACYLGEETNPAQLQPPVRDLQRARKSPLSLLFSQLSPHGSVSCFWKRKERAFKEPTRNFLQKNRSKWEKKGH